MMNKPLLLASSGGGGHIAAMKGIINQLTQQKNIELISYDTKPYEHRKVIIGFRLFLNAIIYIRSHHLTQLWDYFHYYTGITDLLDHQTFWQEIKRLRTGSEQRLYIDVLLDLYPFGYEMAAIFNSLQRRDKAEDILKAVKKQSLNDRLNYYFVYYKLKDQLLQAMQSGRPYTSIISTQPQATRALTDLIEWYNHRLIPREKRSLDNLNQSIHQLQTRVQSLEKTIDHHHSSLQWVLLITCARVCLFFLKHKLNPLLKRQKQKKDRVASLTPLNIQLYMTDLPTQGAFHFTDILKQLTPTQRQHIHLYCIGKPSKDIDRLTDLTIHELEPEHNPMLRKTFLQKKYLTTFTDITCEMSLPYQENQKNRTRKISAYHKVAAIMLGSVGGDATVEYIKPLLDEGYQHIFIFGAKRNETIMNFIKTLSSEEQNHVIALDDQDDKSIAPIMTRSQCTIIRGGGLNTMEQMALPIIPQKRLLIHHKNPSNPKQKLTSGLSWEDDNADALIEHYNAKGGCAEKTCPHQIKHALNRQIYSSSRFFTHKNTPATDDSQDPCLSIYAA